MSDIEKSIVIEDPIDSLYRTIEEYKRIRRLEFTIYIIILMLTISMAIIAVLSGIYFGIYNKEIAILGGALIGIGTATYGALLAKPIFTTVGIYIQLISAQLLNKKIIEEKNKGEYTKYLNDFATAIGPIFNGKKDA